MFLDKIYPHFAEIYFNITGNLAEKCPFRILGLMSFFDLYLFFPSYHITVIQQPFHLVLVLHIYTSSYAENAHLLCINIKFIAL